LSNIQNLLWVISFFVVGGDRGLNQDLAHIMHCP